MRALCGIVPSEVPGTRRGIEYVWRAPGALYRKRLHRLRDLFLLLSGAGGDHGVPAGDAIESGGAGVSARGGVKVIRLKVTAGTQRCDEWHLKNVAGERR